LRYRKPCARRTNAAQVAITNGIGGSVMSELTRLEANLKSLGGDVSALQEPVNNVCAGIAKVKSLLAKPKQLSSMLGSIRSRADTLSKVARFLSVFPIVGTVMGQVANVLRRVSRSVGQMKLAADRVHAKLKPAKEVVTKGEKPVASAKQTLDATQARLTSWLGMTTALRAQFGDTPPAAVEQAVAGINAAMTPPMTAIDGVEKKAAPPLKKVDRAFSSVERLMKPVTDSLAAAEGLTRALSPLEKPLNVLRDALKPVEWALQALSWVAKKVIDPIVKPILCAFRIDRLIAQLEGALNPLAKVLAPLSNAVAAIGRALASVTGDVAAVVTALEPLGKASTDLDKAMRPLSGLTRRHFAIVARAQVKAAARARVSRVKSSAKTAGAARRKAVTAAARSTARRPNACVRLCYSVVEADGRHRWASPMAVASIE
jgi:peptidoglycan hydrolase CwlO-like protein